MSRLAIVLATSMLWLTVSTVSTATHVPDYSRTWTAQESLDAGARGSILSMDITNMGTDPYSNTIWYVAMTLDTTNYVGYLEDPLRVGFNAAGFGAIQHWDPSGVIPFNPTLISVTGHSDNLTDEWGDAEVGVINSGVDGPCASILTSLTSFKICTEGYSDINAQRGEYVWLFQVLGGTVQDVDDWHWSGQYSNLGKEDGRVEGWIISTDDTIIPEPSAALVFAIGFGVISAAQRKR